MELYQVLPLRVGVDLRVIAMKAYTKTQWIKNVVKEFQGLEENSDAESHLKSTRKVLN